MEIKYVILVLALVMYLLVIIFQEKKVWMTSAAALAVIVLGFLCQGGAIGGHPGRRRDPGVRAHASRRGTLHETAQSA